MVPLGPGRDLIDIAATALRAYKPLSRGRSSPTLLLGLFGGVLSAGAPPRLGKGHPSSAARGSDPPLAELAPPLAEAGCGR
jgi:hypothetical protein